MLIGTSDGDFGSEHEIALGQIKALWDRHLGCMKHKIIAHVVKPRRFLKTVWANFRRKQFASFYLRIVKEAKSNVFTCKLCAWVIFIILLTGLLCDRIPSRTNYKMGKVQHFHVQTVWLYISCTMASHKLIIVTWMFEDLFSFVTSTFSKGCFLKKQ